MKNPPAPSLKNAAAAPVVYFDMAPCFGLFNGMVEIELAAQMLQPKPDGSVQTDLLATAHLRCGIAAALSLREALDRAIAMSGVTVEAPALPGAIAAAAPPPAKH